MRRPTPAKYELAVELATDAIRKYSIHTRITSEPIDLGLVIRKLKDGDTLTRAERLTVAAHLEGIHNPNKRGRPLGSTVSKHEGWAVSVGLWATRNTGLPLYRGISKKPHNMSRCDAVAEAMRACKGELNFNHVLTYETVELRAKNYKRRYKNSRVDSEK